MRQIHSQYFNNGIPSLKLLILLAIVVLTFDIYSISTNWISGKLEPVVTENEIKSINHSMQGENTKSPSKTSNTEADVEKESPPVAEDNLSLKNYKQDPKNIQRASLKKQDKALVVMILMSLKNRKM